MRGVRGQSPQTVRRATSCTSVPKQSEERVSLERQICMEFQNLCKSRMAIPQEMTWHSIGEAEGILIGGLPRQRCQSLSNIKSAFTERPTSLCFQTKTVVQDISAWGEAYGMRSGVNRLFKQELALGRMLEPEQGEESCQVAGYSTAACQRMGRRRKLTTQDDGGTSVLSFGAHLCGEDD